MSTGNFVGTYRTVCYLKQDSLAKKKKKIVFVFSLFLYARGLLDIST
jgi:hypothetical protein